MSVSDAELSGGLVISRGGYSGGALPGADLLTKLSDNTVGKLIALESASQKYWAGFGVLVAIFLIVVFMLHKGGVIKVRLLMSEQERALHDAEIAAKIAAKTSEGYMGSALAHASGRDDTGAEFMRTQFPSYSKLNRKSSFMNSREAPYFPDVTNRVLRMENREKEAVRALAKINQERLRRSAGSVSNNPLQWGAFYDEWKKTHPLGSEGMRSRGGGLGLPSPY